MPDLVVLSNIDLQRLTSRGQRKARDQVRIDRDCVDWYYLQDQGRGSNAFWRKVAHRWFKVNGLVRYTYTWNQIFP